MEAEQVYSHFRSLLISQTPTTDFFNSTPVPIAAIKTMIHALRLSTATTTSELLTQLKDTAKILTTCIQSNALQSSSGGYSSSNQSSIHQSDVDHLSDVSIRAGCDLFFRLLRSVQAEPEVNMFRNNVVNHAELFLNSASLLRNRSADCGVDFIQDDCIILVHSFSRVVMTTLQKAYAMNKRFKVFVSESRPTGNGVKALHFLRSHGIPASLILDSAVAYVIHRVSMVLVGAEGVVENGGIINHIGTYQISLIAKTANKPLYVAVESYKFVRLYPLSGVEVGGDRIFKFNNLVEPSSIKNGIGHENTENMKPGVNEENNKLNTELMLGYQKEMERTNPLVDYTPPQYITLLFTDKGVLTPSAVSDELIKMFS